jgi:exosortase/archaeosortase family protein
VPTDTARNHRTQALSFALRFVVWTLGLFGTMRLAWFEAHAVLPLTQIQGRVAERWFGTSPLPIEVTLACSGADALALCAGAILAYPARWNARIGGAAGGIGLVLLLNTIRIGTLGRAVAAPAWFEALHVYIWPALLTLAIAGYVFAWMRLADTSHAKPASRSDRRPAPVDVAPAGLRRVDGRFIALTAVLLLMFAAASPLYLQSAAVLAVAAFIAHAAAVSLRAIGMEATATANVLFTPSGGLLVTQECISTPLIPVYLAAVWAYSTTWGQRIAGTAATVPLFAGLGIARLLVVALPAALIGSPLFLIHAFYQLLLAAVVVGLAACWRHGAGATAWRRTILGGALGTVCVLLLTPLYARASASVFGVGASFDDPQGAIALMPAFQVGLYVALSVAAFAFGKWRRLSVGFAILAVSQIATLAGLHFLAFHVGVLPHVRDIRAWAIGAPLLLMAGMVTYDRSRR